MASVSLIVQGWFFSFWVPCCDALYDFRIKAMSVCLYFQLVMEGSCPISHICLFAQSGVQHILCCVLGIL